MGRFTERDEFGNADIIGVDSMGLQCNLKFDEFNRVTNALNKLAEYEDLEEKLQSVYGKCDDMLQKVVECLERHEGIDIPEPIYKARLLTDGEVDRWEEFKALEEQGKMLRLPCAVGDTVYQNMIVGIDKDKRKAVYEVFKAKVFKFSLDSYTLCFWTETADEKKYQNEVPLSAFGKTVFLTKAEAEAALGVIKEAVN